MDKTHGPLPHRHHTTKPGNDQPLPVAADGPVARRDRRLGFDICADLGYNGRLNRKAR